MATIQRCHPEPGRILAGVRDLLYDDLLGAAWPIFRGASPEMPFVSEVNDG
jgi:hypothetical protein